MRRKLFTLPARVSVVLGVVKRMVGGRHGHTSDELILNPARGLKFSSHTANSPKAVVPRHPLTPRTTRRPSWLVLFNTATKMVKDNPETSLITFSVGIPPLIDFPLRISTGARAVAHRFDTKGWAWVNGNNTLAFRERKRGMLVVLAYNVFMVQSLGLGPWLKELDNLMDVAQTVLREMKVESLNRIGIRTKSYLDPRMSHSETVAAMFGSYLVARDELNSAFPSIDDLFLRLYGTERGSRFEVGLVPQTAEQVQDDFYATPNLDQFNEERAKTNAAGVFAGRLEGDRLLLECEAFRKDPKVADVSTFMRSAIDLTDELGRRAYYRLLSLPIRNRG